MGLYVQKFEVKKILLKIKGFDLVLKVLLDVVKHYFLCKKLDKKTGIFQLEHIFVISFALGSILAT